MRRSHTVRNHMTRPSLALGADDLGLLKEGDESNEDVLRRQLLERDRECERVNNQNLVLKQELSQRPSIDEYQEFHKEKKNLEIILQGTQRENERFLTENNRLNERVRILEKELSRLLGDSWQSSFDSHPPPTTGRMGHQRTSTMPHSPLIGFNGLSSSPVAGRSSPRPSSIRPPAHASRSSTPSSEDAADSKEKERERESERLALHAKHEEMRLMVLAMEQRISTRDQKLEKLIDRATKESEKNERLAARLIEA